MHHTTRATAQLWIESPLDRTEGKKGARLNRLFDTHPPLEERIKILEIHVRRAPLAAVALVAVAGLTAAACGSGGGASETTTTEASTTTTTKPVVLAPLTGLPDPEGVSQTRASLGVKIENTPEARPQSGLDFADVVYEEVVEGGITRFWGFFNSAAPENVGPIRSVRSMDPNIILPFGGVVAFSGGTEDNVALVRSDRPRDRSTRTTPVRRSSASRRGPRRTTSTGAPRSCGPSAARRCHPSRCSTTRSTPTSRRTARRSPASRCSRSTCDSTWGTTCRTSWDPARDGWARFQQGIEPFMAAGFPETQVAPTNVIVQFIPYGTGADGDVMGAGEAWVFSNGQLIRGTWGKAFPPAATQFTDAAGQPITLTPGRTWIMLAPIGTPVDIVAAVPPATTATTVAPPTTTK